MNIRKVVLETTELKEMKDFYVSRLGFLVLQENATSFRIAVGTSELEFTSENVEGDPYYHFAFNIPSNKFTEAKAWAKEKVRLNVEDGEDDVYFSHMDAYAFYFYDPAGNIVEFIARSTSDEKMEAFSAASILNISEMSLTVDDAITAGKELKDIGIKERDDESISSTSLNFMGDRASGVFLLLVQPGRKWIFSDKVSVTFPQEITLQGNSQISINKDNKLTIDP
ncbi:Glyoxalase/Bleomycin resistance protein/Dioxygenase superfamily protein [Thalassobacillus cyri]|uniref:Glyoxalase/Bleomycin resistance protein/Dioxygenase superfamily protein n=1 Tax=Thalassobacillus cyri TaxID=571932 RepID=A0A1H3ZG03_9BACI|nr:VOC family protein [Thalassobacillus cyri]SEA22555.1 Glyoxalase/Bleomycin resistance protein/Dioxygenase superfamily protein [Thalassobacillus cyri]